MGQGVEKMMSVAMRKPEGPKAKMEEMAAIGDIAQSPAVPKYASAPEEIWDSVGECDEALKSPTVPVGYCFGTIDPLLQDYWDSSLYAIMNAKGARTVILEGECRLMELDCPDRVAAEVFAFIDESRKSY